MNGHVIVVDLGFGDAGKGTVVDWLCRDAGYRTVVRYNGGAQAAHNVVTSDGRHHTFAQWGAGTFVPGVRTHLAHTVMVDPLALIGEAEHLASVGVPDAFARITVDERALLTTPWHRRANQVRERARGAGRHGSCGMGIGETARYALRYPREAPRVGDCRDPRRLRAKLETLARRLDPAAVLSEMDDQAGPVEYDEPDIAVDDVVEVFALFADAATIVDPTHMGVLLDAAPVVFEGAQGVLLDEWAGFHPYTTWSTTTTKNACRILADAGHTAFRLGVTRTYTTRHGAGPLPTEDESLSAVLPEPHNGTERWQGRFRVGHFDAVAVRYAVEATGGVDGIAVTHLDAVDTGRVGFASTYLDRDGRDWVPSPPSRHDLTSQGQLTREVLDSVAVVDDGPGSRDAWLSAISRVVGAPVIVCSDGPTADDKRRVRAFG